MTGLRPFSIPVASLLFCVCIGTVPGFAGTARASDGAEGAPIDRPPIVGGTPFPDLYHYRDQATDSEVWSVSPPRPREEDETPRPPLYIAPEINLPWPWPMPRSGSALGERP